MTSQPQGEKPKLKISRCRHDTGRTFIETIEEETVIATITDPSSEMWQLAQQLVSVWNASLESCDQPATPSADEQPCEHDERDHGICLHCGAQTDMNADDYVPSNDLPRQCSVTPRTDAIPRRGPFHHYRVEDVLKVCKQLERELASLQSARDEERGDPIVDTSYTGQIASLKAALAERDREIEEVKEVIGEVDKQIGVLFWTSDDGETIRDGRPQDAEAPEAFLQAWTALRQLLARINPTNPTK